MKYRREELVEIPKSFYSFLDDKPFSKCVDCERDLLSGDTEYLIERVAKNYKGFKATDVIFDYAICMACAMKLHEQMSHESRKMLLEYFQSKINPEIRQVDNFNSIEESISRCLVSGISSGDCDEYQICAHCVGDKLFIGNPPYMISGQVIEKVMQLLSVSTQDILNGFYQKIRTPSPGIFEPDPRPVLF